MGFKTISLQVAERIKATHFLLQNGYSKKDTQKLLDKNRIKQDSRIICKKDFLEKGYVEILSFMPDDINLIPFFACVPPNHAILKQNIPNLEIKISQNPPYFCVFNKPSKLLTHPKNLADSKSILDSLRYYFGKHANPCHRLDYETSGLLVCSVDKQSEVMLKNLFLQKGVEKSYMAILHGEVKESLLIESEIIFPKDFGNLCIKGRAKDLRVKTIKEDEIKIITKDSIQQDQSRATTILTPLHVFHNFNEVSSYLYKSSNPFFSHKALFSLALQENLADISRGFIQDFMLFTECDYDKKIKQDSIARKSDDFTLQYSDFFNKKKLLQCYESFLNVWGAGFRAQNNILDSHTCHTESLGEVSKKLDFTTAFHANFKQSKKEISKNLESKQNEKFTLVKLFPLSGKTHQLRIHTSSVQHKILGDTLYGLCPVVASLFLDLQSKKLRANIESYLFETLTKKHSSNIQKYVYAIHYLRRDKNIAQTMLYNAMLHFSVVCKTIEAKTACHVEQSETSNMESKQRLNSKIDLNTDSKNIQVAESKYFVLPFCKFLSLSLSKILISCFFSQKYNKTNRASFLSCFLHDDIESISQCLHPKPYYRSNEIDSKLSQPHSKTQDFNKDFESFFFTFLLFYYALPSHQEKILKDIRLHYCSTDRLLLHASSLSFLEECFICE
ncbi:MAG: pseudouridine synthase [Helicobacter sp.]|uniref:pseudouridine synthase n=1 Tax=Helicobacter sp. TaxID=218 RepID=UPI002A91AC95|nr:pseudouridine synthase [Helicobacter sp.]MDY5822900.1 pseudouridine synthase [Helicobacter sp.]